MLENLYKRYGRGKTFIFSIVILIVINVIMIGIIYATKIRFSIEGEKFKHISRTENSILFRDSKGYEVKVTKDSFSPPKWFYEFSDKYKIEYKDKVIEVDNTDYMNTGRIILLSDGSKYIQKDSLASFGTEIEEERQLPFDVQLINHINVVNGFVKEGPVFPMLILGILFILLGLINLVYPEKVWNFRYALVVSGGEPTEWAIWCNKAGGVFLIVAAFLFPIIAVGIA